MEKRKRLNLPPVVKGGNFIFGEFARIRTDPINLAFELKNKYGNVFVIEGIFGLFRTNFIIGEEAINMYLKSPDDKLNFRKGIGQFIRGVFGPPKDTSPEEERRKNDRVVKGIKKSLKLNQININEMLKEVPPKYSKLPEFEFTELIEELIFKINVMSMLGKDSMKDFEEIKYTLSGVEHYGFQPLSVFFPNAPFGSSKKARDLKKRAIEILGPYISKRRQSNEKIDDYLSVWAQAKHVNGEDFDDEEVTNAIINIILAAHINTAVTLMYSLIYLYRNPEQLEIVREELSEMKDNEKDLTNSKTINNVIKETMRLTNAPTFFRRVEEDMYYEGYLLEKGSLLSTIGSIFHFDEKIFPDPYKFKPERWEDQSLTRYGYWFGGGVHRCKGDTYALQILRSCLAEFSSNYDLEFKNKQDSDFEMVWINNRKPKGKIIATLKQI